MEITEEQVVEFRKIYQEVIGKPISREDAWGQATKLIRLMEIIYQPMTLEERRKVEEDRIEFFERIRYGHIKNRE